MRVQADDWTPTAGRSPQLTVTGGSDARSELGRFDFAGDATAQPPALATELPWLGGDLAAEGWRAGASVRYGSDGEAGWVADDHLLMLSWARACGPETDPAPPAEAAYRQLLQHARDLGYPHLLRAWHVVPAINQGSGDAERYRRFCLGRALGLEREGIDEDQLCAASAVGSAGRHLFVHCLAGRNPGTPLENPRQVAAYRYPRQYGPRSPSFARALAIPMRGGEQGLFVSGTASIVGHATRHPHDTPAQLEETLLNLHALLGEAAQRLGRPGLARFGPASALRVYVRDPAEWPRVEARLRREWPDARLLGVQADICRAELTLEIEAFQRG